MIVRSNLLKSVRQENGEVYEYRENDGCIFLCARRFSNNFWEKDKVTVVTVELTKGYINKISGGDDEIIGRLDLNDYMLNLLSM